MKHVFVETNWVVGCAAPEHRQVPAARRLLERANAGELRLHLPAVCLTEARATIPRRFRRRSESEDIREYITWARARGRLDRGEDATVRRILDLFDAKVRAELGGVGAALSALRAHRGVEVFALDDEMLDRAIELGASDLELEPYDQAVLAAVLVRSTRLARDAQTDVVFCELDRDLQPWDKAGHAKQPLAQLYDDARVWVYGDFELIEAPPDWWNTAPLPS